MARNYYYRSDRRRDPKLVNVIAVPTRLDVYAVFRDNNGNEIREPIYLIGLYDNGDCGFLETVEDGVIDSPEVVTNFIRYEFQKK